MAFLNFVAELPTAVLIIFGILAGLSLLYLVGFPIHWIGNLIAIILGIIGPSLYFGVLWVIPAAEYFQNIKWYWYLIMAIIDVVIWIGMVLIQGEILHEIHDAHTGAVIGYKGGMFAATAFSLFLTTFIVSGIAQCFM